MAKMNYTSDVLDIPRSNGGDLDGQAEEWLVYLYSGAASDEGRRRFSEWLRQSPEHASVYTRIEQVWRDLGFVIVDPAPSEKTTKSASSTAEANRQTAEVRSFPISARGAAAAAPRRSPGWIGVVLAAAAMLLLAVGIGWFQYADHDPVTSIRYASRVGENTTVQLADQSSVTLSASSVIITHFSRRMRHVELVRGRAYFDVASDSDRVFSVEAASTEIRVVGTEFDVNKGIDGVRVAVAEGVVDIRAVAGTDELQARSVLQLAAGQQVRALLDGSIGQPEAFDPGRELTWKQGRLQYIDTRLADILAEVNRYREDKIILTDSSLGELRITTTFKTTQTDQLLTGLAVSYPVEISRTPVGVLVKPGPSM